MPNLDIKRTLINNMKRNIAKNNSKLIGNFSNEDLRYRDWEIETEYQSNANIYMMMDVSGSMSKEKRDIAKTFYFWMVQFIKRKYKKVNLFFIVHDSKAKFVNQNKFFTISAAGGTSCSSAFLLAYKHIKKNHSSNIYNNYVFEFSDGDNSRRDSINCVKIIREMLPMCRAIGYGEIVLSRESPAMWLAEEDLLSNILNKYIDRTRLVSLGFSSRDDVFENLKKFFNIKDTAKL